MTMTDDQIVAGLRSDDEQERNLAMSALFPEGEGEMLVRWGRHGKTTLSWTNLTSVAQIFQLGVYLAVQFGAKLGLALSWLPAEADPDQIVIPDSLPPGPMLS